MLLHIVTAGPPPEAPSWLIDLLEGSPWFVKAPIALVVATSPWWVPTLADRRRKRRATTSRHRRAETEESDDEPESDDEELRKLRDTLIGVLQDLQTKSRQAEQLARDLEAKGVEAKEERERAERLARELAELRPEVMRLREQVDALIGRRDRTPPRGQEPPTHWMPRPGP